MSQIIDTATPAIIRQDGWLPQGELGVLVCLPAIPLIWTVLLAGMMGSCIEVLRIAIVTAILIGAGADLARLIWLHRQAGR